MRDARPWLLVDHARPRWQFLTPSRWWHKRLLCPELSAAGRYVAASRRGARQGSHTGRGVRDLASVCLCRLRRGVASRCCVCALRRELWSVCEQVCVKYKNSSCQYAHIQLTAYSKSDVQQYTHYTHSSYTLQRRPAAHGAAVRYFVLSRNFTAKLANSDATSGPCAYLLKLTSFSRPSSNARHPSGLRDRFGLARGFIGLYM